MVFKSDPANRPGVHHGPRPVSLDVTSYFGDACVWVGVVVDHDQRLGTVGFAAADNLPAGGRPAEPSD